MDDRKMMTALKITQMMMRMCRDDDRADTEIMEPILRQGYFNLKAGVRSHMYPIAFLLGRFTG